MKKQGVRKTKKTRFSRALFDRARITNFLQQTHQKFNNKKKKNKKKEKNQIKQFVY